MWCNFDHVTPEMAKGDEDADDDDSPYSRIPKNCQIFRFWTWRDSGPMGLKSVAHATPLVKGVMHATDDDDSPYFPYCRNSQLETPNKKNTETRSLNPENRSPTPEARNPQPQAKIQKPESGYSKPETLNPTLGTRSPKPQALNPRPQTPNPRPQTPDSESSPLNPNPEMLGLRGHLPCLLASRQWLQRQWRRWIEGDRETGREGIHALAGRLQSINIRETVEINKQLQINQRSWEPLSSGLEHKSRATSRIWI